MKKALSFLLAMMLVVGGVSTAFASEDSMDIPGGVLEGVCDRSSTQAYASTYANMQTGYSASVKSTVEAVNYNTGASYGSRTANGRQGSVVRAAVTVPSSATISVYGAHQATVNGSTYGFYTEEIGV